MMLNEEQEMSAHRAMFERAKSLRRTATPAEERLWTLLRARRCGGLRFLRQVPAGQYVLDFYCPAVRLAIEVDGSIHAIPEVAAKDECRQQALEEEMQITFLRLSNTDSLTKSNETLQSLIVSAAESARAKLPQHGERLARLR